MERGNLKLANEGYAHEADGAGASLQSQPAHGKKRRRDDDEKRLPISHPVKKYDRGQRADLSNNPDKKLHRTQKHHEAQARKAKESAAAAEMLLPDEAGFLEAENEMEKTYRMTQPAIAAAVDVGVAKKSFELTLDTYGPYHASFDRSGRHMLMAGEKGHMSMIDWNKMAVTAEFHLNEQVHDAVFLHNHHLFAVAQKKYAYIYDHTGAEVHVLRGHQQPLALDFLPFHFLLASIGNAGFLKYQDTSTGALVAEHRTKLGACSVMRQNPWNAVMCCGHSKGMVTMWTPNMSTPVVKMATHKGPVTALAVDAGGRYMVTGGMDARLKVWDVRKFQEVHNYFTTSPARSIDISQRGLTAVGFGSHVQVWGRDFALEEAKGSVLDKHPIAAGLSKPLRPKAAAAAAADSDDEDDGDEPDMSNPFVRRALAVAESGVKKAKSPYLRHELPGKHVVTLRFRPYDDVLAVGHSGGLASVIVPGAGEPNYDSREADPFATKKARQEAEVHALLDKLPPSMISLEPSSVATVDRTAPAVLAKERRDAEAAAAAAAPRPHDKKTKRRGINKALKKQSNIITEQKMALQEKLKEERAARQAEADKKARAALKASGQGAGARDDDHGDDDGEGEGRPKSALSRFFK